MRPNAMYEDKIIAALKVHVPGEIKLEIPPDPKLGDFAFACFSLAKEVKKSPVQIASELAQKIKKPVSVEKIVATGPYVNFFLSSSEVGAQVIADVLAQKKKFGSSNVGNGKKVAIEFSSPNIGKPMHFGHLRGTIIGNALSLIHEFTGHNVIRLNYLGDWGTQFGALMYAYTNWGSEKLLKKEPVKHLYELYVKFNDQKKKNPALQDFAREWFSKLENNDKHALKLWKEFKESTLKEFLRLYKLIGVTFDSFNGEAHAAKSTDAAIELVQKKKLAEIDQGALIVRLPNYEMPLMLRKSDESTTYASRDMATIIDRVEKIKFETLIYVVGHEQALHFQQLFALAHLLGYHQNFIHVANGLYLSPDGGKMSTREGKAIFMEDVINELIELAQKIINEKNPDLRNKKKIAQQVGIGALFFGDLMNDCSKDVVFDIQRILSFEGDTGPYLMYTHARAASIIDNAKSQKLKPTKKVKTELLAHPSEIRLIKLISAFSSAINGALLQYKPHILAQYLIEFGRAFNEFYHACPCLSEENKELKLARLALIEASRQVLENGLRLLGISAPREM